MTTPISFTKPYPSGFRNEPDLTTSISAAALNSFQDTIAALVSQVNLLTAGGGTGGVSGVTFTDNGDDTLTMHVATGAPVTVVDNGDHYTLTVYERPVTDYVVSKPVGDTHTKTALKTFMASVGLPAVLGEVSGAYPTPGADLQGYTGRVIFAGPDVPTSGGTTARTDNKAVAGLDWWFHTP